LPFFFAERVGGRAVVRGKDAAHLARSLRARAGESIEMIDRQAGLMLSVRLETVYPERVEGVIVAEREHRPEPTTRVIVAIANLPAPALELVLSRCTEVGAAAFHVIQADRSVARGARGDRWQAICREAAMLAGRLHVPEVAGPSPLEAVIAACPHPVMLVRGGRARLTDIRHEDGFTVLIGPEGGWSERELALAPLQAGLGPRNLRADTAAIVALARVVLDR
jgi:16S rRNA (uracil1498-N3)-methyltransferase